jgi:hypothetical protein
MAILPYMHQLPADYYRNRYPVVVEVPIVPVVEPPGTISAAPPFQGTPVLPPYQLGGTWVGGTPPSSPSYGWLWLNSNNGGLYIFGDPAPGVWTQIGTNW